jgi:hypothetical protein
MAVVSDRERDHVDELEAAWALPSVAERKPSRLRALDRRIRPRLGRSVVVAWILFIVAVFAFEPAGNAEARVPLWVEGLLGAFWLTLALAALAGIRARRVGLALSGAAAGLGIVLAIECRATQHHVGPFWLAELAGSLALLALSAAAFRAASRR